MAIRIFSELPPLAARPHQGPKNDRRGTLTGRIASNNPTPQNGNNPASRVVSETLPPGNRALNPVPGNLTEGSTTENNSAPSALDRLVEAIDQLTQIRANTGTVQNQLPRALTHLNLAIENLTAAEPDIQNANLAEELARATGDQIRVQSAKAATSQANLPPQGVFGLIEVP